MLRFFWFSRADVCFLSSLSRPGQTSLEENRELIDGITGFEDSVRKCEYRPLTQHVGQHATTLNTNRWFN